MIHYHGLPINPSTVAAQAISGGHAFISFRDPHQLSIAVEVCQSFAIDNGAFSAWRSGEPVTDWNRYYEWVSKLHRIPNFDFAVIPDSKLFLNQISYLSLSVNTTVSLFILICYISQILPRP